MHAHGLVSFSPPTGLEGSSWVLGLPMPEVQPAARTGTVTVRVLGTGSFDILAQEVDDIAT